MMVIQAEVQSVMAAVLTQLRTVEGNSESIYRMDRSGRVILAPHGITIEVWYGQLRGYHDRRTDYAQGIKVRAEGVYGRSKADVIPVLNRTYKFPSAVPRIRPEDNNFMFNAAAAHRSVSKRVEALQAAKEKAQSSSDHRLQNTAVAFCSLAANSIDVYGDGTTPDFFDTVPFRLKGKEWSVSTSEVDGTCRIEIKLKVRSEDVGYTLWKLLSAKESAMMSTNPEHSPFTAVAEALKLIPYVIEERLTVPDEIRDKVHLKMVSRLFAEWLSLAGRTTEHAARTIERWEASFDSSSLRLEVLNARKELEMAGEEIRALARTTLDSPLSAEALEDILGPKRVLLAKAHGNLVRVLALLTA